jgi:hypothetical protein
MTVMDLKELLEEMDEHVEVVIQMSRDGDLGEEPIGNVVQRDSIFGEGQIVAIVPELDLDSD